MTFYLKFFELHSVATCMYTVGDVILNLVLKLLNSNRQQIWKRWIFCPCVCWPPVNGGPSFTSRYDVLDYLYIHFFARTINVLTGVLHCHTSVYLVLGPSMYGLVMFDWKKNHIKLCHDSSWYMSYFCSMTELFCVYLFHFARMINLLQLIGYE